MINYELAKQLKNAGFPQKGSFNGKDIPDVPIGAYVPTLSELIEACGDEFDLLEKQYKAEGKTEKETVIIPVLFRAYGRDSKEEFFTQRRGIGIEADVAVANLWLELNKKESQWDFSCKGLHLYDATQCYHCGMGFGDKNPFKK